MDPKSVLLQIFAKYPTPGKVKTRLQSQLTPEQAVNVYKELVQQSIDKFISLPEWIDLELWGDEQPTRDYYRHLLTQSDKLKFSIQQGDDLGTRMSYALQQGLMSYQRVIIIGVDCPVLSCSHIINIALQMCSNQLDLIAAEDGGYVLLAAMDHHPGFFYQKDWGTSKLLEQTRNVAEQKIGNQTMDGVNGTMQNVNPGE